MSPTRSLATLVLVTALAAALPACGGDGADEPGTPTTEETAAAALPEALFADTAPADPSHVFDVKQSAKEGDEVTVRGRVGGSKHPFVEGRAALTIADTQGTLTHCGDNEGDGCPTPWDYCCDPPELITANTATIQIVDADGRPLKLGIEGAHGLENSVFIVVTGTVGPRPDANVLVINATSIHVEQ